LGIKKDSVMSTKILIAGGSGFLGAHIARHLADRGDQVLIYDLVPPSRERAWLIKGAKRRVQFEKGSLEDLSSLFLVMRSYRIEKVLQCAAILDVSYLNQNPLAALRTNVMGTINVLEVARLLQVERVVFASSNGVLTVKQYEPVDENHPVLLPEGPARGFYGASKVSCEAFGLCYWKFHGLNFISLRPSSFYGLGMQIPLSINQIVEGAVKGESVKVSGVGPRDYVYINDVVSAFVKALDVEKEGVKDRIFMIGTGRDLVTPAEAARIVKEMLPLSKVEIEGSPPDRDEFKHRGVISIERARRQLGYEPQYSFRAGIEDYIKAYKEFLNS
jgi:nucleoside-diphosphate-sugar epimerase